MIILKIYIDGLILYRSENLTVAKVFFIMKIIWQSEF